MMKIQRCNSYGDELSSESDTEYELYECEDCIYRHKCLDKKNVFYFKTIEDSKIWGIYIDECNKTRCLYCKGLWPINLHIQ